MFLFYRGSFSMTESLDVKSQSEMMQYELGCILKQTIREHLQNYNSNQITLSYMYFTSA